jgi:two-component system, cell cycle sensor histidine kinase and response regulator CckA
MPVRGTEKILLVDDEGSIRDLGTRILTRAGYEVISAADGKEALNVYSKHMQEISLVILDVIMPQMGGKQCLKELLQINPDVKVVIASGYSSDDADLLVSGAVGFIHKPYDMQRLLRTVREILDKK